jgi:hypothetical protein
LKETLLVVGKFPYKLLNGDVVFPWWEVNFDKQILASLVVCLSKLLSSIFDLLPRRSTWVCYLCVHGSLPFL